MSFTDYLELEVLDQLFGGQDYVEPANWEIALSTTTPTDAGANFTEPVGNGYARVVYANDKGASGWNNAAAGLVDNKVDITFPAATGAWGTVTHFGIYDQSSPENLVAWGVLTASKVIGDGDTAKFAAGDLDVTLD